MNEEFWRAAPHKCGGTEGFGPTLCTTVGERQVLDKRPAQPWVKGTTVGERTALREFRDGSIQNRVNQEVSGPLASLKQVPRSSDAPDPTEV